MDFKDILVGVSSDNYGDQYRSHVMELYKTYLEMTDRISARRENTNSFFLTINTAAVSVVGYLTTQQPTQTLLDFRLPVAIAGMAICYLWYRIIRSYRDLNSAKFKVIHEIEKLLPLRPYDAEWEAVGRGEDKRLYLPFTHIEVSVPWVFMLLYLAIILLGVPWNKLGG
ncbi:MAG: hypothetical protein DKINENOH_03864 [bacterium]|nr:hypothetical protein [bacterium]